MPKTKKLTDEELCRDLLPAKSHAVYMKTWAKMKLESGLTRNSAVAERHLVAFFQRQKAEGKRASTLWSLFSHLNAVHQVVFSTKIQREYPRVLQQLKAYEREDAAPKQSASFTEEQVDEYAHLESGCAYDLVRKALFGVMYFGGLRATEAKQLLRSNVQFLPCGSVQIGYEHAKQRNPNMRSASFLIPPGEFAQTMQDYLTARAGCANPSLWVTGVKGNMTFKDVPLGIHQLYGMPAHAATRLGLHEPFRYTGHAVRRTTAQILADHGATSSVMMRHMGWRTATMVNTYAVNSNTQRQLVSSLLSQGVSQAPLPGSADDE